MKLDFLTYSVSKDGATLRIAATQNGKCIGIDELKISPKDIPGLWEGLVISKNRLDLLPPLSFPKRRKKK